jgi:hypothetical protein
MTKATLQNNTTLIWQLQFSIKNFDSSNFIFKWPQWRIALLAGLPDGIFSNQNSNLGKFWICICIYVYTYVYMLWPFGLFYFHFVADRYILFPIGIFCCQLVYFVANWYILLPIGIFCCQLVYLMVIWYIFHRFWYSARRRIWRPWLLVVCHTS